MLRTKLPVSDLVEKPPKLVRMTSLELEEEQRDLHVKARTSPYPETMVWRLEVPDNKVPWEVGLKVCQMQRGVNIVVTLQQVKFYAK